MNEIAIEQATLYAGPAQAVDPFATLDRAGVGGEDVYFFREGTHGRLYQVLGAHPAEEGEGTRFAVWAPNAAAVSVIGDFNGWRPGADGLEPRGDDSGIWEGLVCGARPGDLYKYRIDTRDGRALDRGDPFARWSEAPPGTASRIWLPDPVWSDDQWMQERVHRHDPGAPLSIYQVHLGSWRRVVLGGGKTRFLDYQEAAEALSGHVAGLGFTHVALLPVMEHPRYDSLGLVIGGHFSPTARYGPPEAFMALIDRLHRRGIGVILDWVPSHFALCDDGLARFDGTALFERGEPDAHSRLSFDLSRPQVRSFLLSAALYWLDRFHADGLRLVAGPAPADDNRPLRAGLTERIAAAIREEYPDALCITAREAGPSSGAGETESGRRLVWDDGWTRAAMDGLVRGSADTAARAAPAGAGPRVVPLPHQEATGQPGGLLMRMPGDEWQKRARLRLLLGYQYACAGKKLLFMGGEMGQAAEWNPLQSLDWHLLEEPAHLGLRTWVRDLNRLYAAAPALSRHDRDPDGLERLEVQDDDARVLALLRRGEAPTDLLVIALNLAAEPVRGRRIGVPRGGWWQEMLNSDAWMYGGDDRGNLGGIDADPVAVGGQYASLLIDLPPLGVVLLQYQGQGYAEGKDAPPSATATSG